MPKLTFFPLGNADCCRIDLTGGEKLVFDYANTRCSDDDEDKRADLPTLLRKDLDSAKRKPPNRYYEVVAFTHLDDDHICGSSEFFYLRHAKKYQDDERVKINEMWVPALAITEEGCTNEAKILQAEARHRLKEGDGIRVFSRPEALKDWLEAQGLTLESRKHLITDAGQIIPGFSKETHGVEFFVHSPFAWRQDDGTLVDRNAGALIVQATFAVDGVETKLILSADADHEVLSDIVKVTKRHKREERLEWDVFKLPHHCSYLSLGPDKGKDKTEPVPDVAWLFETQAQAKGIVVSTSKPIPSDDEDPQPPHRQAANYHRDEAKDRDGEFKVTMEHPKVSLPEPLVIIIDRFKATIEKLAASIAAAVISRPAPRAG
jgi:hypothetical protein